MHRVTGQVLWLELCSPKGFMPSVLRPNLMFLASAAKSLNSLSIFLHCVPSAGCLNSPSDLRSSLCHRNNLACSLFLNRRFNRGIIGAYHITFAGTISFELLLFLDISYSRYVALFSYGAVIQKDSVEEYELLAKQGGEYPGFISWFKKTVISIRAFLFFG